jgi:hypothetical protein
MLCPSKTRFVVVCFLATLFASFGAARADAIPEIVAKTKQAVVEIVTYDQQNRPLKTGTGFFISPDGALHIRPRQEFKRLTETLQREMRMGWPDVPISVAF